MENIEKIQTFRDLFKGHQDVVPGYWKSKDGKKAGYSPLCRNEWKEGICQRPCRTCQNADYIPLSNQLILDHFKGKHILGVYPLLENNTCNFIGPDFDNHDGDLDPLKDVQSFYEVCEVQDIPTYPLRSRGGKGYHSPIFFDAPVPAWKARAVTFALLTEGGVIGDEIKSSFDRLLPNQDQLSGKGFGNLIGLPFQGKAGRHGHTLFLDPISDFKEPYKDQWSVLASIETVTENHLDELISTWGLKKAELPKGTKERVDPDKWFKNGIPSGRKHTDLFRYACQKISQGLGYDEVLILTTELARRCDPLPKDGPEQAALDRVNQAFQKYGDTTGDPTNEPKKRATLTFS